MREFIEKKTKSAKIFRIILVVLPILWIVSMVLSLFIDVETAIIPIMLFGVATFTCAVVYFVSFHPFMKSIKWLENSGLINAADDIVLDKPTLPRSKIFCGQNALFCKKPSVIIPYAQIAWTYLYERRSYGLVLERAIIIHTNDGLKFSLYSQTEEFKWLLDNYILKNAPNVVVGYGKEQKARYKELNPDFAKSGKSRNKILGTVLMCLGAVFTAIMIINFENVQLVPLTVMIVGAFVSGAILLFK